MGVFVCVGCSPHKAQANTTFFGDQDVEVMGWPDVIVPTRVGVGDTVLWIKSAVKRQI